MARVRYKDIRVTLNANIKAHDNVIADVLVGKIGKEKIIQIDTYDKDGLGIHQKIQLDEDTIRFLYAQTLIQQPPKEEGEKRTSPKPIQIYTKNLI